MGHLFHCCWFGLQVKNTDPERPKRTLRNSIQQIQQAIKEIHEKGTNWSFGALPCSLYSSSCVSDHCQDGWMDVELAINCSSVCPHLCLANVSMSQGWAGGITNMSSWGLRRGTRPLTLSFSVLSLSMLPLPVLRHHLCTFFIWLSGFSFRWISGSASPMFIVIVFGSRNLLWEQRRTGNGTILMAKLAVIILYYLNIWDAEMCGNQKKRLRWEPMMMTHRVIYSQSHYYRRCSSDTSI